MSLRCIRKVFLLWFIFLPGFSSAQFGDYNEEKKFLNHLTAHRLYKEKIFVLDHMDLSSGRTLINLEKAWTYSKIEENDSSLHYYNKVNFDSIKYYNFHPGYFMELFKHKSYFTLDTLLEKNTLLHDSYSIQMKTSVDLMNLRYRKKGTLNIDSVPVTLRQSYADFLKYNRKSGGVAGLLSAAVPGLGKVYVNKNVQGLNMLLLNLVMAAQAYESYRKSGIDSPRFIIFGGVFSLMYISNILGSIWMVKKNKRDHSNQLHYEISNYHLHHFNNHPW